MEDNKTLQEWVAKLSQSELPVLKHTARELAVLRADESRLNAHAIAKAIAPDPIMTVKLLRYLQSHKHRAQTSEVVQVEQALLMLGMEPFFNKVAALPLIEDMLLKEHAVALPPLLRVVHRSHRASAYAYDWAVQLRDMHFEEVRIAALLHDMAEILMWCFAPDQMLEIRAMQQHDKSLRSRDVQQQVLGFGLLELQRELAVQWGLPELLLTLMDDAHANNARVRNVALAVNLARHSANGWDDAALPDDYRDIGELLRMKAEDVFLMVGGDAGIVCDLSHQH
jgi:HD-like signal output (HDOD) protein